MDKFNQIKKMRIKLCLYYQSIQQFLLSIFVVGILEYFFLFDLLMSLLPAVPLLALEVGPIIIVVVAVLLIKGLISYLRKKAKENKHFLFI